MHCIGGQAGQQPDPPITPISDWRQKRPQVADIPAACNLHPGPWDQGIPKTMLCRGLATVPKSQLTSGVPAHSFSRTLPIPSPESQDDHPQLAGHLSSGQEVSICIDPSARTRPHSSPSPLIHLLVGTHCHGHSQQGCGLGI